MAEFIKKWNENTIDEPIHDFSLIDSERYNEISIHVDLGNSTSSALDGLLKHLELNLSNPRIKKIGLQWLFDIYHYVINQGIIFE